MFKVSLLPADLKVDSDGAPHEDYPRKFIDTWEIRAIDDWRITMKLSSSVIGRSCIAGAYSNGETINVSSGGSVGELKIQRVLWFADNGAVVESRLGWVRYNIVKSDTTTSVSGVLGFMTETETLLPTAQEKYANIDASCDSAASGTRAMDAAYRNKLENGLYWRSTEYLNMFQERVGISGTALTVGTDEDIILSTSVHMNILNSGYTLY